MTLLRRSLLLPALLLTAPACAQDAPALELRFAPGETEVYRRTVRLDGVLGVGARDEKDFTFSTELAADVVLAADAPIAGAVPLKQLLGGARVKVVSSWERVPEASYELPDDRAGFGGALVVRPTGHAEFQRSPMGRLPGAPKGTAKRAGIDFHCSTLLNAGVLPGRAVAEWVGASDVLLPGGGWEDDFVGVSLRERYRIAGREGDRVTIVAELEEAGVAEGPWFKFSRERFEAEGRLPADRWIQASFALGGGVVKSERRLVLDVARGKLLEASSRLELSFMHGGRTSRLVRTDEARLTGDNAPVERIARARAATAVVPVYDVEVAVTHGATKARVTGRVTAHRKAESAVEVAVGKLEGTLERDGATSTVQLPEVLLVAGAAAGPAAMLLMQVDTALVNAAAPEQRDAVRATIDLFRAASPSGERAYPWQLPATLGLEENVEARLTVPHMTPGPPVALEAAEVDCRVERDAPGKVTLRPLAGDAPPIEVRVEFDPETRALLSYALTLERPLEAGGARTVSVRWTRAAK